MPSIDAPAKINLTLEILARRADGYHGLRSVMIPLALYDHLGWEPAPAFGFTVDDPALRDGNLVLRALAAIGLDRAPLTLRLEKHVPVGGGLGGGSSDAAAVLRAAMQGSFGALPAVDWLAVARALGSDVPFFLADGGALVEGTGERVTPLGGLPAWWVVLYIPSVSVATGEAYGWLDAARAGGYEPRPRADSTSIRVLEAVQRGDFDAVVALAQNDFEPVIAPRTPAVARALDALRAAGAPLALLSGSGACVFALARNEAEARAIVQRVSCPPPERCFAVPFHHGGPWARA